MRQTHDRIIEMLKCRGKKHFYSAAPKKIICRLSFSLIGANGSLLDFFFVWSPVNYYEIKSATFDKTSHKEPFLVVD